MGIFNERFPISLWNHIKVNKFQNEFMKSSVLPKYEPNIALCQTTGQTSLQFMVDIMGETLAL